MKNDLVSLTIDGKPVQVAPGTTLLLAAKANHIDIPTLCYHPELKPEGHCRLCVVEIGEAPRTRLVNSCTYPAEPGLVVQTASEKVLASRRMVMELLLAQAPGAERLKEMAAAMGVYETRFTKGDPAARCILCGQCVRTCREVVGVSAISMAFRTPGKAGGHALQRGIGGLHRLRLLRLHLPHQHHRLHREGRHPHRLGPEIRTPALQQMRQLHRAQGPTGTLGQTHRRPGGEFLYVQGLPVAGHRHFD